VTARRFGVGVRVTSAALAAATVVSGCLGDPAPEPETAPLEVVVGSSQRPDEACLLNRPEVAAGTHELLLVTESGPSTVTIRDNTGAIVFQRKVAPGQGEASSSVELSEGRFVIECAPRGARVTKARLRVVPAGPSRRE
jgi:hypothetical protein